MKRILLTSTILLFSIIANAQGGHFTFRDIPITGSVKEVGEKLMEIGYEPTVYSAAFTGKFAGSNCKVYILESEYTQIVHSIVVGLDPHTNWNFLKMDYDKLKTLYSEKYGNPSMSQQSFDSPYYDGDGHELFALKQGKCNYLTAWYLDNGHILMAINNDCAIKVFYVDKTNNDHDKQAKEKAIKSEI